MPGAGAAKLAQPKEKLAASPSVGWAEHFSPVVIKTIGGLEVLAALGLILPAAADIAPDLVPLAASGLALTMFGAAITHTPITVTHLTVEPGAQVDPS